MMPPPFQLLLVEDNPGDVDLTREALRERFGTVPVRVPRGEVEELGAEIGLKDPAEAARLFDRLKGVSWRGAYVRSETGWTAAWVEEIS